MLVGAYGTDLPVDKKLEAAVLADISGAAANGLLPVQGVSIDPARPLALGVVSADLVFVRRAQVAYDRATTKPLLRPMTIERCATSLGSRSFWLVSLGDIAKLRPLGVAATAHRDQGES